MHHIFWQKACLWSVESVFLFSLLYIHGGSVSESLAEDWSNSTSGHWSNCNDSWGGWRREDSVQMLRGFACIGETFSNLWRLNGVIVHECPWYTEDYAQIVKARNQVTLHLTGASYQVLSGQLVHETLDWMDGALKNRFWSLIQQKLCDAGAVRTYTVICLQGYSIFFFFSAFSHSSWNGCDRPSMCLSNFVVQPQ